MTTSAPPDTDNFWRILLCHKHPFSARLRFLVPEQRGQGVLVPEPLPPLAVIAEPGQEANVLSHPAMALSRLAQRMPLDERFEIFSEFHLRMEVPEGVMPVYMGLLSGFEIYPAPEGMRWIDLTQSIGMPWLDREILRRAYETMVG